MKQLRRETQPQWRRFCARIVGWCMQGRHTVTFPSMRWVIGVAGAVLLATVLWDAFETIILPRRVSSRFRLTKFFYRATWGPWRAIAPLLPRRLGDAFLSFYGPLSLLLLLALWAAGIVLAFGMLQSAADSALSLVGAGPGFGVDVYMSGTTFFTLGLGDVVPRTPLAKTLTVVEAGTGFAFLAVVIGYFPVIYQAFSRREMAISLLDARAGSPPTAGELLWRYRWDQRGDALGELLQEWERWAADVLESHLSYPALAYFRSQHYNQSWLAALTTILDSSALVMVGLEGWCVRQAALTFAMARHAVVDLAQVFSTPARACAAAHGRRVLKAAGAPRRGRAARARRRGRRATARGVATHVRAVRRRAGALPRGDAAALGAGGRASRQLANERVGAAHSAPAPRPLPAGRRSLLAAAPVHPACQSRERSHRSTAGLRHRGRTENLTEEACTVG